MKLIISEKAIAGKRIAEILSQGKATEKTEKNARLFEFSKEGKPFLLIPLRGHIMDVDFPKQYSQWLGTDVQKLVMVEVEYIGTEKSIISLLKAKAPLAEEVIIATDADREGEAIGVEAIDCLKEKNPKIKITRAYFSAITPKDIQHSFSNLGEVDYNFAESTNARREIDLVWGAVLTRFISLITRRMGKEFLSVGRVQSPVLALIVKREKERNAFNQEKYWLLRALFEKDKKEFEAFHKKGRFKKKEEVEEILKKGNGKGTVVKVIKKKRVLQKPFPFNTTNFLRAATAIGFSAGEAMNIAEHLYQQGFCSYPRTDNSVYSPNLNLIEILNELLKVNEFTPLIQEILSQKKITPSRGKETKDHPPIHPTSAANKTRLNERQWKIYELICRRFMATLAEEAVTENLSVEIDLNKEIFVANGQIILKEGWKHFYPYSVLKEVILPELSEGDSVDLKKLEMLEKMTQPPPRYSQGALIKLMEDLGLGTKATRHEIIQKLYARRYISGIKAIEPNKVGFAVIESLEKHSKKVTEPKMTAEVEREMDEIAAAKKEKKEVVDASRKVLQDIMKDLVKNKNEIAREITAALVEDAIMGDCPACDGRLRIVRSRNNKRFLGCTNYPKCTTTFPLPQKGRVELGKDSCKECGKPTIKVTGKRYRYTMCVDPHCKSKDGWKKKSSKETKK
ncbi:MAG: DNA topoisomerase I [archaeon]